MGPSRRAGVVAACVAFAASTSVAGPAVAGDAALAEVLFQEGKKLVGQGRFAEACPKLAESQRLDPAGGTLTALALCHESEGKTATAWAEFGEVLAGARRDGRADREAVAKEHLAALEPKLAKLSVEVAPGVAALAGLEIKRDGVTLGKPAWGTPAPVDPGTHVVEATAPGREAWKGTIVVSGGEAKAIAVDRLEAPRAAATIAPAEAPRSKTGAYVVGGVGVVFLGVASVFGLQAIAKAKSANDACPNTVCPDAGARGDAETARRDATIANVGVGLGAVMMGVSAYLFLSGPGKGDTPQTGTVRVAPAIGPGALGWNMGGAF